MRNLIKSSLLVLALGAGSAALAQTPDAQTSTPPQQHAPNPQHQAKDLARRLGLSPDQTAQIEPILADRDQKVQALLSNTSLDRSAVRQQRRAIMTDTESKINAILTPAQQQQWATLRQERQHGHGQSEPQTAPPVSAPSL